MLEARRWGLGAVVGCALAACGGGGDGDGEETERVHSPSTCDATDRAPLRDGMGAFECVRVGARGATLEDGWPASGDLEEPIVYVQPGAGGDGSQGAPFGSIADAVGSDPASIVLAEGRYELGETFAVTEGELAVAGAGASSVLVAPDAGAGVRASGATTALSLTTLAVEGGEPGILVENGATVALEDVTVEDATRGVVVDGATVTATRLTVRRATEVSVRLADGAGATIRESLLRDGEKFGVVARDSQLDMRESFVTEHGRDGIALLGGIDGELHVIERVTSSFNGVTAMRAEEASAVVEAGLVSLSGTRVPEGTIGGDGLYVGGGATVRVDGGVGSDAERGMRSDLVGNARAGALVSGDGSNMDLRGALVGSNRGLGVFLQDNAGAETVGYNRLEDNDSLGIGVASGAWVRDIPCNFITGTLFDTLATSVGDFEVGDGISMTEGTTPPDGMPPVVRGNTVSENERFGIVLSGANATLSDNAGDGNRFGLGVYVSDAELDGTNAVAGTETSPESPPPATRGELAPRAAEP